MEYVTWSHGSKKCEFGADALWIERALLRKQIPLTVPDDLKSALKTFTEPPVHWNDQKRVAAWATKVIKVGDYVHMAYKNNIPLYFLVLRIHSNEFVEMRGLWRSLQSCVRNVQEKKGAFGLIKWSLTQHDIERHACVRVQAQIGLVRLFKSYGIDLPFLPGDSPIYVPGSSVQTEFFKCDLLPYSSAAALTVALMALAHALHVL